VVAGTSAGGRSVEFYALIGAALAATIYSAIEPADTEVEAPPKILPDAWLIDFGTKAARPYLVTGWGDSEDYAR